ncbi:DnaT-like ssDNA-binding protein [Haematobacter sp.]|nr:DnaT-like ssDNA-binding protein [Haematobacter sp.]
MAANGYVLPDNAPTLSALREQASDYIDATYGVRFVGTPTGGIAQERAWPRSGAMVYGQSLPDDIVPSAVVAATYYAAWASATGSALFAVGSAAGQVTREKVDVIEVQYAATSGEWIEGNTVRLTSVEGLLAPYLRSRVGIGMMVV